MASTDDLLDLRGIGQRSATFQFEILDQNLNRIGLLNPDREAAPTVSNVMNQRVKRTLNGLVLPQGTATNLNPFTDRIRPVMLLENGARFDWGVFLFLIPTESPRSSGTILGADLGDQCLVLDQPIVETVSFLATTNMGAALATCFEIAGYGPDRYEIDQIDTVFGSDQSWKIGTSLLDVMNQIAAKAGCYSVFFDRTGLGRVKVLQDIQTATATIRYRGGNLEGNILRNTTLETQQAIGAPNRYLTIDTSANDTPIIGVYTVPSTAPNSKENIGYYRTRTITESGLPDAFAAVRRSQVAAAQDAADYVWTSFQGVIDPRHDTFEIVDLLGVRYREQKWGPVAMREGATMPHDLRLIWVEDT